jgi:thioredoxin-related protein
MKLKILIVSFLFVGYNFCFAQSEVTHSEGLNWQQNFETAKKIAKKENKAILVFFTGSDWCGPCKMLVNDFFKSEKFKSLAKEELILYKADFPRNKDLVTKDQEKINKRLQLNFNITGYPTVLIIDYKEKNYGLRKGYGMMRETSYHFDLITQSLNRFHKKNRN